MRAAGEDEGDEGAGEDEGDEGEVINPNAQCPMPNAQLLMPNY
ncbi:MAG: hypothetical protein V7L23_10200 [Nostoc sp.]